MTAQALLHSLFRYKAKVDEDLVAALETVRAVSAPDNFRAALRVLDHAQRVDRIFAAHLSRTAHGYGASWSDDVPELTDLAAAMRATDRWYLDYTARVESDALDEMIGFTFTDGAHGRMSRAEMLAHVITHGGYHRGEAGRLLPEIDSTAMRDVFAGYLHAAEPQRRAPPDVIAAHVR